MSGWLLSLIAKPFVAFGFIHVMAKIHAYLFRVLPDGKVKTMLLRER